MNEHYFSDTPKVASARKKITVKLCGTDYLVTTDSGVFSNDKLDLGTQVLLKKAPALPETGNFLDCGCGWGPIAMSMALESPKSKVYALDVNSRCVELTKDNAKDLNLDNIKVFSVQQGLDYFQKNNITFDVIWSNPPIRVGKSEFHAFLRTYLDLLSDSGKAYLVVQKNLGADTCINWLNEQGYKAQKFASQKGYRIIEVGK